jgi:hypothetical protein
LDKENRVFDRNVFSVWRMLLALSVLFIGADSAMAYVGPGAGLEFVGYFMSLALAFGIALSAVLLWPFYALIRFIRGGKAKVKEQPPTVPSMEDPRDGCPTNQ